MHLSILHSFFTCIWLIQCHFMHPSSCIRYVHTCTMHTSILVHDHLHIYALYDPSPVTPSCISHVIVYLASCIHLRNIMIASMYITINPGLLVKNGKNTNLCVTNQADRKSTRLN